MRQRFSYEGESYWFDSETKEYEYDGDNQLILGVLESMSHYERIETQNSFGIGAHPGEVWKELEEDELRRKVMNSIRWIDGVEFHEN